MYKTNYYFSGQKPIPCANTATAKHTYKPINKTGRSDSSYTIRDSAPRDIKIFLKACLKNEYIFGPNEFAEFMDVSQYFGVLFDLCNKYAFEQRW